MVYLDYDFCKRCYERMKTIYNEIADRKRSLFEKTQPISARMHDSLVSGGVTKNSMEQYVIALEREQIEERLTEAASLLAEHEKFLRRYEAELKKSQELIDQVYYCRFILNLKTELTAKRLGYCPSHIYRIVKEIRESIEQDIIIERGS